MLSKINIICNELSKDNWLRLASCIDNGFVGTGQTFSVERKKGYYFLNTNKCDDVSMIRVFCSIGEQGIDKIDRIAGDTESWEEIQKGTYSNIEKFLNELQT